MLDEDDAPGWATLLRPKWLPALTVLLGGILMHSMNVLLVVTVLPSVVEDIGGVALLSWPTTAFMASSIVAASCTSLITSVIGARGAFAAAAMVFCVGTLMCAMAPSMHMLIAGRFVQGFGGGLVSALAYVLVRNVFPESVWSRVFAAMAGIWSVSVLVGPLVGGVFARLGDWRGAFYAVAVVAVILAVFALRALPRDAASGSGAVPAIPVGRLGLIALAIVSMSLAAVIEAPAVRAILILLTLLTLALMLRLNRYADVPLLPSDAFSFTTGTGIGLWLTLLVSVAFSPLAVYGTVFLQRLHGLDPLTAGYIVAAASLAWTLAAIAVSGLPPVWAGRLFLIGPCIMVLGLAGTAALLPTGPIVAITVVIALVGAGIGSCWAFKSQRVMISARAGEGDIAAAAVITVEQVGIALGAAVAGLVANVSGMSTGLMSADVATAAFWVPAVFALVAVGAMLAGARLRRLANAA